MKYYVVLEKNGSCMGYTTEREMLDLFIEQRNASSYNIIKLDDTNKKNGKLIKSIIDVTNEMGLTEGTITFPSEEEYFFESLSQMFIDLHMSLERLCKLLQYFNLNSDEGDKVRNSLAIILKTCNTVDMFLTGAYDEDDMENDELELTNFLKMDVMLKVIIDDLK